MRLINMTDFVLWQHAESSNQNEFEDNCYNYAKFLKRPLELGMFVPVDEDDEILYPEYVGGKEVIYDSFVHDDMMDKVLEYNKAKEKVLFEYYEGFQLFSKEDLNNQTIEHLLKDSFDYVLTESAIKQLGL